MTLYHPKKGYLKFLCQYLHYWLRYMLNKEFNLKCSCPPTPNLPKYRGSSVTFLMYWVDTIDNILKVLCQYIYYWLICGLNKENRPIVIMPPYPKLTQSPRVIHDILEVMGRPQGSYPQSFMSISLILATI